MAVQTNRKGLKYSENIIGELLTFNKPSTWNVTSGTGSAIIDNDIFFEGSGSLKIENLGATDLTVSNSSQSTIINQNGKYQLVFHAYKSDALYANTVTVNIFKNAVLSNSQSFTIGSTVAEDDKDSVWLRYVSDVEFDFSQGDDITFTFTIDNGGRTNTVWIDGIMLCQNNRENPLPPSYSESVNKEVIIKTGFESITQTGTQSLTGGVENLITISGTKTSNGGLTLLDANGKVTPIQLNDVINIDFRCELITPTGSDNYVHIVFKDNGNIISGVTFPLLKGSGNTDYIGISDSLPITSTLLTNGVTVYIEPNVALDISDKKITATRIHIAK